jgi:hypothetical protein
MEVMDHAASLSSDLPIIIAGDFNTKAHGVARLSPWYCGDWMRVGSIGNTESEVNPSHALHSPRLYKQYHYDML